MNEENANLEREIADMIIKNEELRLAEVDDHEKAVTHLRELNADY